jgi:excisionase family DNA binding protein
VSRLVLLEVSPRVAVELAHALNLHREWARREHRPVPAEFAELRDVLVRAVPSGLERPSVDGDVGGRDAARMAPLLLTYAEAADALGLSERQVRRLVADGRIPVARAGRAVRIHREDLEAFADSLRASAPRLTPGPVPPGVRFKEGDAA